MNALRPLLSICLYLLVASTVFAQVTVISNGSSHSNSRGAPDIVGNAYESDATLTNSANREAVAKSDAYDKYLVRCVARAFMGLPIPTISHENYYEYSLPEPGGFSNVTGNYEIWLDDPLAVLSPEPEPVPNTSSLP